MLSLYDHPDAEGYWEQRCEGHLRFVGFKTISAERRSFFIRAKCKLQLVVHVDDFKMAAPIKNMAEGWELIRPVLKMEEPTAVGLDLGCEHRAGTAKLPDGTPVRAMTYDMDDNLDSRAKVYCELTGPNFKIGPYTVYGRESNYGWPGGSFGKHSMGRMSLAFVSQSFCKS